MAINTICQGQHAILLWPIVLKDGNRIAFAHTDFKWQNLAANNAGVTVVIVGLSRSTSNHATLFYEEDGDTVALSVSKIGPYLVPNIDTIIQKQGAQIFSLGEMLRGNMPYEGGHLLLSMQERDSILLESPAASPFIRRISGSSEIIDGKPKYCVWIEDADLKKAMEIEPLSERLAKVRTLREGNKDDSIKALGATPHRFREMNIAEAALVAMLAVSSEKRDYLPVDLLDSHHTITNRAYGIFDGDLVAFSILASRLQIVWVGTVCGRLERRYSYTNTLGWNTFPTPKLKEQHKADLTRCAEDILLAREAHFPKTIAELYDPEKMPEKLPPCPRSQRRSPETHLHRPPLQKRHRTPRKAVRTLHKNDRWKIWRKGGLGTWTG